MKKKNIIIGALVLTFSTALIFQVLIEKQIQLQISKIEKLIQNDVTDHKLVGLIGNSIDICLAYKLGNKIAIQKDCSYIFDNNQVAYAAFDHFSKIKDGGILSFKCSQKNKIKSVKSLNIFKCQPVYKIAEANKNTTITSN